MSLLINKDGKQLGPFSIDEARGLVRAGSLSLEDWAWPDGANDWLPLKEVPGFSVPAKPAPVTAPVASTVMAGTPATATTSLPAEEELWSGHPSQLLNVDVYLFWIALLSGTAAVLGYLMYRQMLDSGLWGFIIFGIVAFIGAVNIGIAYFHLRTIEYIVTTQRVRIISGLFSKNIQEIELFRVKDTMANQSFLLRLFGLGTITILSGDERMPKLILSGVPGAIELRERLRTEVMNLRQRFGVRELDVM